MRRDGPAGQGRRAGPRRRTAREASSLGWAPGSRARLRGRCPERQIVPGLWASLHLGGAPPRQKGDGRWIFEESFKKFLLRSNYLPSGFGPASGVPAFHVVKGSPAGRTRNVFFLPGESEAGAVCNQMKRLGFWGGHWPARTRPGECPGAAPPRSSVPTSRLSVLQFSLLLSRP